MELGLELLSDALNQLQMWLSALMGWVTAQPEGWGGWLVLFGVALIAATIIPLGSEVWLLTLLAAQWSPTPLLIAATAGNTLGAMTTFAIGRWGSGLVHRPLPASRRWHWAMSRYQIYGSWTLLLSWLPIVGDLLVLMAGGFRASWWLSLILITIGKFVRYGALIAGYLMTSQQQFL